MKKNSVYSPKTILLYVLLSFFASFSGSAQNFAASCGKAQKLNGPDWSFRENKGQLMDKNQSPLNDVPFYGRQGSVNIYCKSGQISFVFAKAENDDNVSEATGRISPTSFPKGKLSPAGLLRQSFSDGARGMGWKDGANSETIQLFRADLILLGCNPNAEITASGLQAYYENYYTTGDAKHGITNVRTYKTITYKNIYPNIDMVLEAKPNGMEYSFIVSPGGNVADIQLQWNGLDNIKQLENGRIEYAVGAGLAPALLASAQYDRAGASHAPTFTETAPYSYQLPVGTSIYGVSRSALDAALATYQRRDKSASLQTIPSSLVRHGSHLSFSVDHYDKTKTLIIDPTVNWPTYFGGSSADVALGITHDGNSNVYITGYAESTSGIASSGAYQTALATGATINAIVAKFDASGSLAWSTYYGGRAGVGSGAAITADASNNIYITGNTNSASLPTTSGAYQTALGGTGSYNAFVAQFSAAGALNWATYYGGSGNDYGNGIAASGSGSNINIYIAGATTSTNLPGTSGGYQTANAGGNDAFIAKFSSSGSFSWATYYGGGSDDEAYGVTTDINDNVFITGQANSRTGIATSGAFETIGNSYPYCTPFAAGFTSAGAIKWGTYLGQYGHPSLAFGGGDLIEAGYAIVADANSNVYVTGTTTSRYGIASSGAYQTNILGFDSFTTGFVMEINPSGSGLVWGTYYGANNYWEYDKLGSNTYQAGTGIALDASNNIYITGYTLVTQELYLGGVVTSDAFQYNLDVPNIYSYNTPDAFLAVFESTNSSISPGALLYGSYYGGSGSDYGAGITLLPGSNGGNDIYIAGYTGSTDLPGASTGGGYQTSFGGGTDDGFIAEFDITGAYHARLNWLDPPNCAGVQPVTTQLGNYGLDTLKSDSIYWAVNRVMQKAIKWTGSLKPDSFTTVTLGNYNFAMGTDTIMAWSEKPNGVLDSFKGHDTVYLTLTFNASPAANAGSNQTMTLGDSATIGAATVSGDTFSWTSKPSGFTSTSSNPTVHPTVTTTYYLTETITASGCSKSDSVIITIFSVPLITGSKSICANSSASYNVAKNSSYSYAWSITGGSINSGGGKDTVSVKWGSSGKGYLKLVQSFGTAKDSAIDTVTINPPPSANAGTSKSICSGSNDTIGATAVSGNTYSWTSNPSGFTSTISNPSVSSTTTTTYYLTEKITATTCSKSDSVVIAVNPLPTVNAGTGKSICSGANDTIGAVAVSGDTYSWTSNPSGFTSTISNPSVSSTTTTTYYLTEKITATTCSKSDSVVIAVNPLPIVNAGTGKSICSGANDTIGAIAVSGDTYSWTANPSGFTSTISNPSVSPTTTTTYYLTEKITASTCSKSDSLVIKVNPLPAAATGGNQAICKNSYTYIGAKAVSGDTYSWISSISGFTSTVSTPYITPTTTTTYILTETITATNCHKTDTAVVTVNPLPDAHWTAVVSNYKITFTAEDTNSKSYLWYFRDGDSSLLNSPVHTYKGNGSYTVSLMVTSSLNCISNFDSSIVINFTSISKSEPGAFNFNIFPNPFTTNLSISYTISASQNVQLVLTDITGKQIAVIADENQNTGQHIYTLDPAKYNLPAGIYFLRMVAGNETAVQKIIRIK